MFRYLTDFLMIRVDAPLNLNSTSVCKEQSFSLWSFPQESVPNHYPQILKSKGSSNLVQKQIKVGNDFMPLLFHE